VARPTGLSYELEGETDRRPDVAICQMARQTTGSAPNLTPWAQRSRISETKIYASPGFGVPRLDVVWVILMTHFVHLYGAITGAGGE